MSGIVLSSSVRQNLLSLQSTADLLATTQNRLATGKKVNTALDNPTNYFTAASLDNRASDINNLLDGIGNGVQVLQAANTGISSLQKLVDSAKSVATQALQATVGYASKSSFSVTINGATSDNLLGTGAPTDASVSGSNVTNNQSVIYSASTGIGAAVLATNQTAFGDVVKSSSASVSGLDSAAITGGTALTGAALSNSVLATGGLTTSDTLTVNGTVINFTTAGSGTQDATHVRLDDTLTSLLGKIDAITGGSGSNVSGGLVNIHTGTTSNLSITGTSGSQSLLSALNLGSSVTQARSGGVTNSSAITTSATLLSGVQVPGGADGLTTGLNTSDYLIVNNKTITFHAGNGNTGSIGANNLSIGLGNGTVNDILSAINTATGGTATVDGTGKINLATSTTTDISLSGSLAGTLSKLGLSGTTSVTRTAAATPAIDTATTLSGASGASSNALTTAFGVGDTITVNGQNLTFVASGAADNTHINIGDTIGNLLTKIDVLSGNTGVGAVPSTVTGGHVALHTGAGSDLSISSSNTAAFAALGFNAPVSQARGTGPSQLNNLTLGIGATGGGVATNLTFGSANGQIKSLNDLNLALSSNNLQATLASNGTLTITTSNDAASSTIGTITGTAAAPGALFNGLAVSAPVVDAGATATRNNLVTQYNNILNQITTTAQDASFNGVNLLSGDTLKLTFNETGKSTLSISGVNFNSAGLGLATLASGDFKDNDSVNKVVSGLAAASSTLRSQASAFGSNLSIVQIRQDFSKNLINVLQTGSSNLTLADTNEEAANSQALSTRQSIAVSALALANQSQQSVLQLLR
jgi:flagellin-like hook-associated protein FlgL